MLDKQFVDRLVDSVDNFGKVIYDEPRERREEGAERTNEKGGQGTHLPYGLCKKYGINLPKNATPKQAWSALKKMGVTPQETFESLEETGTVERVKSTEQYKEQIAKGKEAISLLKKMGVDVSKEEGMSDEEWIDYLGLDKLVTNDNFDSLPKETQQKAVKTNQQQYADSLRYTKKRKDEALWFTGAYAEQQSYDHFKPKCWEVWKHLNDEQKEAMHAYTDGGYWDINSALRGIKDTTDYVQQQIEQIDSVLDRSVIREDCWLQRGVGEDGAAKFLDLEALGYSSLDEVTDPDELIGLTPIEKGYMSCGSARGTGFSENITFNIFVPKGTHGMYLAPISEFGGGTGSKWKTWDGSDTYVGNENETLLHRGLKFEVTKAKKEYGRWYIDLEVIPDNE